MERLSSLFTRQLLIATAIFTLSMCALMFLLQMVLSATLPADAGSRYVVLVTPADEMINNVGGEQASGIEATVTPRLEGVVEVGMQAIVSGTGGRGLRMRQNPGSESVVNFLALEGERVEITDGPVIEDGYIWWKLISLDDPAKTGWSVQDFLEIDGQ
jgi:hypothetical protein